MCTSLSNTGHFVHDVGNTRSSPEASFMKRFLHNNIGEKKCKNTNRLQFSVIRWTTLWWRSPLITVNEYWYQGWWWHSKPQTCRKNLGNYWLILISKYLQLNCPQAASCSSEYKPVPVLSSSHVSFVHVCANKKQGAAGKRVYSVNLLWWML